ncbi:hypothetical protein JL720_16996 [Aureococcus anophagefferens]|nr:hypothetical protein JL720_16996 [Aureococcus anophagefferens]
MGGDRVNVFARVRPWAARAPSDSEAVRLDGDTNITVDDIEGAINESLRGSSGASLGDALKASAQRKTFEFDGVFGGESEQAEVFKEVGLPVVGGAGGYHGCVFAYGQAGSGKTYSLLHGGSAAHSFQDSGLLPRLAATLYVKAARDVSHDYTRSGVAGKELKEAININGSLLALGNVVAALAAKKKHVPYRDSKLTRVLEGSVGGNCKTALLCCCSPSADSTSETLAALAFAARAMRCECKAVHAAAVEALAASEAAAKEARAEKLKFERAAADSKAKGSRAEEARKEAAAEAERLAAKEKQVRRELEAACASAKNEEKRRLDAEERLALLELSAAKDAEALKLRLDEVSRARDESKSESARLEEALAEARKQARERQLAFAREERALADQLELDNERASDKIFGVESEAARKSKAARRRDEVASVRRSARAALKRATAKTQKTPAIFEAGLFP